MRIFPMWAQTARQVLIRTVNKTRQQKNNTICVPVWYISPHIPVKTTISTAMKNCSELKVLNLPHSTKKNILRKNKINSNCHKNKIPLLVGNERAISALFVKGNVFPRPISCLLRKVPLPLKSSMQATTDKPDTASYEKHKNDFLFCIKNPSTLNTFHTVYFTIHLNERNQNNIISIILVLTLKIRKCFLL